MQYSYTIAEKKYAGRQDMPWVKEQDKPGKTQVSW